VIALLGALLAQALETDVVSMKDGRTLSVLILSETDAAYEVQLVVKGAKGQTTGTARMTVNKADVAKVERMSDEARAKLTARATDFATRAQRRAAALAAVKPVPTRLGDRPALKTVGANFEIVSTCEEPFVREVTCSLEEIFTAYQGFFNIKRNAGRKIAVTLLATPEEYVDFQKKTFGGAILNPAFYGPERNIIVAYNMIQKEEAARVNGEIRKASAQIEEMKKKLTAQERAVEKSARDARQNIADQAAAARRQVNESNAANKAELRKDIDQQEKALLANLKEREKEIQREIAEYRKACQADIAENTKILELNRTVLREQNRRMFETLFHEGFHAFVSNYLFEDGGTIEVPRWLNEGMAMYFEMSVVVAGELVHGGLQKDFLKTLQERIKAKAHLPLRDVLRGGPEMFLVTHVKDADRSALAYAESWALVHYLTGRVNRETLGQYVTDVLRGAEKDKAFEKMMGKSVEAVEKDWIDHVSKLK
jgi:hypothetical protein